ncbi:hypothetical protein FRC08_018683 [Ceratobasidium sp. 394]|nr:hypothetical protein FRC08_018683 [Ceratobasidium sp. 394]
MHAILNPCDKTIALGSHVFISNLDSKVTGERVALAGRMLCALMILNPICDGTDRPIPTSRSVQGSDTRLRSANGAGRAEKPPSFEQTTATPWLLDDPSVRDLNNQITIRLGDNTQAPHMPHQSHTRT